MTITARSLHKSYDAFDLSISDLTVRSGTVFGLVGNNGAGKTTFLRLLLDLIEADDGSVALNGASVSETVAWKKDTGSFLGERFLIDFLTPDEYWHFVGSTYDLSDEEIDRRLEAYSDFYTDEPVGETTKYIRDLSQGNRNKAGIVAALLPDPDLLVFDEPFASLDPRSQIWLKDHLSARPSDATVVVSSHDLDHVAALCDRIAILEEGSIVRDAPTDPDTLDDLEAYFRNKVRAEGNPSI
jgi:ABC-2 type transport system ATP-binding protein